MNALMGSVGTPKVQPWSFLSFFLLWPSPQSPSLSSGTVLTPRFKSTC